VVCLYVHPYQPGWWTGELVHGPYLGWFVSQRTATADYDQILGDDRYPVVRWLVVQIVAHGYPDHHWILDGQYGHLCQVLTHCPVGVVPMEYWIYLGNGHL
jgi:hypothetical protein